LRPKEVQPGPELEKCCQCGQDATEQSKGKPLPVGTDSPANRSTDSSQRGTDYGSTEAQEDRCVLIVSLAPGGSLGEGTHAGTSDAAGQSSEKRAEEYAKHSCPGNRLPPTDFPHAVYPIPLLAAWRF
jgi:hypothetical protein